MKRIFTKEELSKINQLYLVDKLSITLISKMFQCSNSVITRVLKEMDIEILNRQNLVYFDLDKDIIPEYLSGISLTKLAQKYKTTRITLSRRLKERGIDIINHQNKTKFEETIFDSIDTEEKAYWLGFIFADGYIDSSPLDPNKKTKYGFQIGLKGSDVQHLYKFNIFMKHNKDNVKMKTIWYNDTLHECCLWQVSNKHLWVSLNNLGCTPRKSPTLKFPDKSIFKDKSLIRHFIRGYFDGDGCITFSRNNPLLHLKVSFVGTLKFLESIKIILEKEGINSGRITLDPRNNCFHLNIHAQTFLDYIYSTASIYLDRKFKLWKISKLCRSTKEFVELLETNIMEGCDANHEVNEETKESSSPQRVETEPAKAE